MVLAQRGADPAAAVSVTRDTELAAAFGGVTLCPVFDRPEPVARCLLVVMRGTLC